MSSYIKLSTKEFPRRIGDIGIDPAGIADYAIVERANKSFNLLDRFNVLKNV
jgi:hypothetical protein